MKMQDQTLNATWLLNRGYTAAEAARCLNVSKWHVAAVVTGKRTSLRLAARLRMLPQKPLELRRRRAVKVN